ncbi:Intracellular septation protein [Aliiroseovarius sp. xm-m-379]|uniref:Inner membrane-spanning protein YciB n=1 Tax=Aliiroseovarius crassostreae TaxID=154981 RepID=A0A0P7IXQ3_9RHOB|nr:MULTISPECIES: inner membrane-spanning protein YciB [Aliiroseovarius]KPN63509.1 Intracellular septation protein A [Aliiroseovarius crassostreae]NRP12686.1 Intracellular septation protein [Aliiroseovarius sp. xm-d-517]NRP24481.1 Intracellular septation protein [Aliiroseovarius sp. xm-m-379]NRP29709.1 Intracellular septation protein [Aliiroseovarius sp. xm-m-314]NRP33280.1 Intracellular septation protein [Aliiroseovarius sp. xm-a-104]
MTDPTPPVNPTLKTALEYGPIVLFFVAYTFLKDQSFLVAGTEYSGFVAVTALFIPVLIAATLAMWKLTGHLSKMQIVTLVLVVVFGGLSIWFNDERFFKMKPTIIYLLFAGILGFGLMRGQSYLESVLDAALPLEREGWMILTKRLALFFLGLAVANEVIWRMMSTDAWVNFKTFGLPLGTIAFFATQSGLFKRYGTDEENSGT